MAAKDTRCISEGEELTMPMHMWWPDKSSVQLYENFPGLLKSKRRDRDCCYPVVSPASVSSLGMVLSLDCLPEMCEAV